MEIIRGKAEKVRNSSISTVTTTTYSDGFNSSSVSVDYVCLFLINGKPIKLTLDNTIFIHEGDEVKVAGNFSDGGIFMAVAYRNCTLSIIGKPNDLKTRQVFSIIGIIAGIVIVTLYCLYLHGLSNLLSLVFIPLGLIFFILGIIFLRNVNDLIEYLDANLSF